MTPRPSPWQQSHGRHRAAPARGLALLLILVVVAGACSRDKHRGGVPATPAPNAHAADVARQFLALWGAGRYDAMYTLLSADAQSGIARDRFIARYQGIADEATITATSIDFPEPAQRDAAGYPYRITYSTRIFGPVTQENMLPMVRRGGWRVQWSPALIFKELTGDALVRLVVDPPPRGQILDRHGQPLATNGKLAVVGTSKSLINSPRSVPDPLAALAALSRTLSVPPETIRAKLDDPNVGADLFIPLKTLPYSTSAADRAAIERIPGVLINETDRRVYPAGSLAAQTVGYVGPISADELGKRRAEAYQEGDFTGQTGLEAVFEPVLAGKRAARLTVISPDGRELAQLAQRDGAPAQDVLTTLDIDVQRAAETAIGKRAGSVVVLDPRDNSVLALASHPDFDPNAFVLGLSDEQFQGLQNNPDRPFLNRTTLATYPPGSTFKVITAAAALEKGGFTASTMLPCTPVWYGLGRETPKKNWTTDDNQPLTIAQGLMRSCDPVFYQIGLTLDHKSPEILPAEAAGFGVGKPTGINGLDEAPGIDPGPEWKQRTQHEGWFSGDSVNMSIGQGFVTMTPLQIANVFSAIAAGGQSSQGTTFESKELGRVPASNATLAVVREGMRLVVQDPRGTAYSVFAGSGLDAAGKSGTAEDQGRQNHVLFAAFAPRSAPRAVVVAVLDQGEFGSAEAGPITRDVLKAVLR